MWMGARGHDMEDPSGGLYPVALAVNTGALVEADTGYGIVSLPFRRLDSDCSLPTPRLDLIPICSCEPTVLKPVCPLKPFCLLLSSSHFLTLFPFFPCFFQNFLRVTRHAHVLSSLCRASS